MILDRMKFIQMMPDIEAKIAKSEVEPYEINTHYMTLSKWYQLSRYDSIRIKN